VTNIGERAFEGTPFYNNQPDGLVVLGNVAYRMKGTTCPTDVIIPKGVVRIGGSAFFGCNTLESVTIPNSVTSIGDSAFDGCSNLMSVIFEGNAPSTGQAIFSGLDSSCTIYVDKESTGWNVAIPGTWNGIRIEYAPTMYTITFDTNGGSLGMLNPSKSIVSGKEVGTLPIPTRYGYVFTGWWTEATGGGRYLKSRQ
jgi:hypothetical protein